MYLKMFSAQVIYCIYLLLTNACILRNSGDPDQTASTGAV